MAVPNAYAVLALLKDEPAAGEVRTLIAHDEVAALTALGVAEVVDHLIRLAGADEDDAVLDGAQLGLDPPPPFVSLPDRVAAETARSARSALVTADPHLLDVCRDEGLATVPLPDSRGQTWTP